MIYVFDCPGREHKGDRVFEKVIHAMPRGVITQIDCPQEGCGAVARRRMDREIPTQNVTGLLQASHSTTGKGSLAHTTEFAFGKFQENPDGTKDRNHRPFTNSSELDSFMRGRNNLGAPVIDQSTGLPMRKKDGTVIRKGAKLVKFSPQDSPSRDDVRREKPRLLPAEWVDAREAKGFKST